MVPTSLLDLQVGHKRGASPDSVSGEVEHKSGEAEYGKYSAKTDDKRSTKPDGGRYWTRTSDLCHVKAAL